MLHLIMSVEFSEVVGIQMILYENLMRGTLTTGMMNEFQQYLDLDIMIKGKPCRKI